MVADYVFTLSRGPESSPNVAPILGPIEILKTTALEKITNLKQIEFVLKCRCSLRPGSVTFSLNSLCVRSWSCTCPDWWGHAVQCVLVHGSSLISAVADTINDSCRRTPGMWCGNLGVAAAATCCWYILCLADRMLDLFRSSLATNPITVQSSHIHLSDKFQMTV